MSTTTVQCGGTAGLVGQSGGRRTRLASFARPREAPKVFPGSTDREREILALIAQGHPNRDAGLGG
jgi:DNA-binding NarL/FixJ family response regulator